MLLHRSQSKSLHFLHVGLCLGISVGLLCLMPADSLAKRRSKKLPLKSPDGSIQLSTQALSPYLAGSSRALSGKAVWILKSVSPIVSSPILDEQSLYFLTADGILYAVSRQRGKPEWKTRLYETPPTSVFKASKGNEKKAIFQTGLEQLSPSLGQGKLFVGTANGSVFAVSPESGERLWQFKTNRAITSTRFVRSNQGPMLLVTSKNGKVFSLNPETGSILWTYQTEGPILAGIGLGNQLALLGTQQGKAIALDLGNGQALWQTNLEASILTSPISDGSLALYTTAQGVLTGLNLADGKPKWSYTTPSSRAIDSTPALYQDKIYLSDINGRVSCLQKSNGLRLWDKELGAVIRSSPSVVDQVVYVATHLGEVFALDANTGLTQWRFAMEGVTKASPLVNHGTLYLGTEQGKLFALE